MDCKMCGKPVENHERALFTGMPFCHPPDVEKHVASLLARCQRLEAVLEAAKKTMATGGSAHTEAMRELYQAIRAVEETK